MNNVSYDNEKLLSEVKQDMAEFGSDLKVIAIYSIFPEDPDKYYITDYIWGEPVHDSDIDIYEEEMKLHLMISFLLKNKKQTPLFQSGVFKLTINAPITL